MEQWKKHRLGDVCVTNNAQYSTKDNWDNALYLDTGNITDNCIDDIILISDMVNGLPSRARRKVKDKDILFSTVRPNQRHIGILDNPYPNLLVSTGFAVISVNIKKADPYFIYYFLSQQSVVDYLHAIAEQAVSAYPSIKASDIEDLEILLPNLAVQKRISSILKSLDDKIELNRRINDNLEQQAQALFKSWFIDFEPFKDGEFVDSELGMIPKGWRVGSLSDISEIIMGQSPSGDSYNENGIGEIFYQGRTEFGDRFPSIRLYTTAPNRMAEMNSILLSVRAPVGDINVALHKCCIGRGLASIKAIDKYYSFVLYTLKSMKKDFDVYNGEGTVFGSINKDSLNSMSVIIPTDDVKSDFENIVSKLDNEYRLNHNEIVNLTNLRDSLLPCLMSGELKINDLNC